MTNTFSCSIEQIRFLRLRIPSNFNRTKIAMIRELHVYGKEVEIGRGAEEDEVQHRGFGKNLRSYIDFY